MCDDPQTLWAFLHQHPQWCATWTVLAVLVADTTEQGFRYAAQMVEFHGLGHSAAIHTEDEELAEEVVNAMPEWLVKKIAARDAAKKGKTVEEDEEEVVNAKLDYKKRLRPAFGAVELKAGQKLQIQFHDGQRLAQAAGPADPSPIDDPKENPQ